MSTTMLTPHPHAVKHGRFVAATAEQQTSLERQIGRSLYMRGRDLSECVTDEMTAGWLAAERKGADDYWKCLMMEAN